MGKAGVFHVDDRVELINGEIVDMTPIGSRHASVVARLSRSLTWTVGDAALVWTQNPVVLGEASETQPDIALLRPRSDFYAGAHPRPADVLLLIEVADTSMRYDREVKIPLYARHSIPEVWLVDLGRASIAAYRDPAESGYQDATRLDNLRCARLPGLQAITADLSGCIT